MSYPNLELSLNEYQTLAMKTADYPNKGKNMLYPALGCAEEAGEIAGKIKKFWRNLGITDAGQLNAEQKITVIKEMGDNLWYLAAMAEELNVDLGYVGKMNIEKLQDRKARGVIKSEGDNR